MSILSKLTGIGISPKGVKINPIKALGTIASVGTLGAAGPLAGIASHIPGLASLGGLASKIPGVSSVAGLLKGHGSDILDAAQGLQAYQQQEHANSLQNKGLNYATGSYDERAPIRSQAIQELTNDQLPDLSSIYAPVGKPNPYARRGVTPVGG